MKEQKKKDDAQYRKKFDWRQLKKFDRRRCRFIYGYRHAYQFCNNLLLHFFLKKRKKEKKKKKKKSCWFFCLFCFVLLVISAFTFCLTEDRKWRNFVWFWVRWNSQFRGVCWSKFEHYHNCLQMIKFKFFFFLITWVQFQFPC